MLGGLRTISIGALLCAFVLSGCQERQGPPPPDVPRPGDTPQPPGAQAPTPSKPQQQAGCNGPCGTLNGPATFAVAICTAGNQCNLNSALTASCQATGAFTAECTRRNACPPNQTCKPLFGGAMNGITVPQPVFTPKDPACPAATPNSCVFTITLAAAAPPNPAGSFSCNCGCQ